jgi:hypothetical protein
MSFLRWLMSLSFVQNFVTGEVRHLATAAAGALTAWLVTHGAQQSDIASIAEGMTALIVGGAGYGLSLLNAKSQDVRAEVAAQTGTVLTSAVAKGLVAQGVHAQQVADQAQAGKVQAAINAADAAAPKDKASLIADLLKGGA